MTSLVYETLLDLLKDDGYSVGTVMVVLPGRRVAGCVDASKDGQRWRVIGPDMYRATLELMLQLGWDLEDG